MVLRWPSGIKVESISDFPEIEEADRDLKSHNFVDLLARYRSLNSHGDRFSFLSLLCEGKQEEPYFDDFVAQFQQEPLAWLLRGVHSFAWGCEARGDGREDTVSDIGYRLFFQRLEAAWADLMQAANLDPSQVEALGYLINCAIGRNLKKSTVEKLINRARKIDPNAFQPHFSTVSYLCQKWHGSHREMFQFARAVLKKSPEGSSLGALIASAHIERYLYASSFAPDEQQLAATYWQQPAVGKEILQAYHHSIGSPHYQPNAMAAPHNLFAYVLAEIDAGNEAAKECEIIGKRPQLYPWGYFGGAEKVYKKRRI